MIVPVAIPTWMHRTDIAIEQCHSVGHLEAEVVVSVEDEAAIEAAGEVVRKEKRFAQEKLKAEELRSRRLPAIVRTSNVSPR